MLMGVGVRETNKESTVFLMVFIPCLPTRAALHKTGRRGQGDSCTSVDRGIRLPGGFIGCKDRRQMSISARVFQNGVLGFVGKPRVRLAVIPNARPQINQNSFRIFGVLAHFVETRFHLLRHFISRNTRIVTSEVNLSVLMLQIN